MADLTKLQPGTKIRIALENPKPGSVPQYNYLSTFNSALDDAFFLMSIPLEDGKPVEVDDTQRLLLNFEMVGETMFMAAYLDDTVKKGVRRFWKLRVTEAPRHMIVRRDERIKISIRCEYCQDSWSHDENGNIDKSEALTIDISNNGAALYLDHRFRVGEIIMLSLPRVGTADDGLPIEDLVGVVCWMREAPKGSYFRNICGIQYRFGDDLERDSMHRYCSYVKRRYRV